jgi:hypothetical protein
MSEHDDTPFPRWFIRLIVSIAIGLAVGFVGQVAAGSWWAAALSSKLDSLAALTTQSFGHQEKELEDLKRQLHDLENEHREDLKFVDDRFANLKRDVARIEGVVQK